MHDRLAATRSQRSDADGIRTTTVDLRSRACACPRCNACGPAFPSGDAPTDIILERSYVIFDGYFRTSESHRGITYPIEFLAVESPKIITVECRHDSYRWRFFSDGFDDFMGRYRFRTDHPLVRVQLFHGEDAIDYTSSQAFEVKLRLTAGRGIASGDRVKLILQCRPNGNGEWRDMVCLPSAIVFRPLSSLPALARYFGRPNWSVGELGFFIDRTGSWVTVRMTKNHREALRRWLEAPASEADRRIGISTREQGLCAALVLLFYLDERMGESIANFFGDPTGFAQRTLTGHIESGTEEFAAEQRGTVVRSSLGLMMRRIDAAAGHAWLWLGRAQARIYNRASGLMQIPAWVTGALQIVMEWIRIQNFADSVFRTDTLYTTEEEPFFVTFGIDKVTGAPNGLVATNLIPDDTFRWSWHVHLQSFANQFLFWESADAYYLPLLNVDRRVRQVVCAAAQRESDGKTECYLCQRSSFLDRVCSVCAQVYHSLCMDFEFGAADCPRCLQRDVVDPIAEE